MIRFFQSAYPSRLLILFILALILWAPAFIQAFTSHSSWGIVFYDETIHFLPGGKFQELLAFILFFTSVFYINKVGSKTGFISKNSYLTAFFFILLMASFPQLMQMSPFLFGSLFFIIFLGRLFSLQNTDYPILGAFDAGLLLGLSALFFPATLFLFLLIWFALLAYRIGKWRAYAASFLGSILPSLFLFAIYFFLNIKINPLTDLMSDLSFHPGLLIVDSTFTLFIVGLLSLGLVISTIQMAYTQGNKNISVRQHALVSMGALLFVFSLLLFFSKYLEAAVMIIGPAALIFTAFFNQLKKHKWANRFLVILLILIIFNQYYPLFHVA